MGWPPFGALKIRLVGLSWSSRAQPREKRRQRGSMVSRLAEGECGVLSLDLSLWGVCGGGKRTTVLCAPTVCHVHVISPHHPFPQHPATLNCESATHRPCPCFPPNSCLCLECPHTLLYVANSCGSFKTLFKANPRRPALTPKAPEHPSAQH